MIILSKITNEKLNAGEKAPSDIINILKPTRHKEYTTRGLPNKIILLLNFIKFHFSKDFILVQHPIIYNQLAYKLLNCQKAIILIHDISGLRNNDQLQLQKELSIFKKFNYIIVHNNTMKKLLIDYGIKENHIYILEVFDYLCAKYPSRSSISNNSNIVYAGNLLKKKAPFLYQLSENKMNFNLNLYGIGLNEKLSNKNIKHLGTFTPEDLSTLQGDIGLIWDGNYDESDENQTYKNYTKYNNPHKLSCYLAAGLPVIVWRKSAIADFVIKNNLGYTISNIYDINKLDFSDLQQKQSNASKIGKKIRSGYFTKKVINQILVQEKKS